MGTLILMVVRAEDTVSLRNIPVVVAYNALSRLITNAIRVSLLIGRTCFFLGCIECLFNLNRLNCIAG